jgi:apolipoprotein N-acyltransferase
LAVLSGVLLALSFPKFGHGAVAWVALAPLLIALPGASGGRAFRLGYLTGAVSSLGLLYWTALVVIQYGGLALPVGIAIMGLLCAAVALFPSLFALLV